MCSFLPSSSCGGRCRHGEGLFVGKTRGAADHRFGKAHGMHLPLSIDSDENGKRKMILVRSQAAKPVAQRLGKHGNHPIGEVDAVAPRVRLAIQLALGRDDSVRRRRYECPTLQPSGVGSTSIASSKSRASSGSIVRINRSRKSSRRAISSPSMRRGRPSASRTTSGGNSCGKRYFRTIESMSTPGLPAGPSTSMMWPSGLTWREAQASSCATTLSPIPAVSGGTGAGT